SWRVVDTVRLTSALLATSATTGRHRRPRSRTWAAVLSMSRQPIACSSGGKRAGSRPVPVTTRSAPSSAKARAVARPMPRNRPAPVTIATLPSRVPIIPSLRPLFPLPLGEGQGEGSPEPPRSAAGLLQYLLSLHGHKSAPLDSLAETRTHSACDPLLPVLRAGHHQ